MRDAEKDSSLFDVFSLRAALFCLDEYAWKRQPKLLAAIAGKPKLLELCRMHLRGIEEVIKRNLLGIAVLGRELDCLGQPLKDAADLLKRLQRCCRLSSDDLASALLLPSSEWATLRTVWQSALSSPSSLSRFSVLLSFGQHSLNAGDEFQCVEVLSALARTESGNDIFFLLAERIAISCIQSLLRKGCEWSRMSSTLSSWKSIREASPLSFSPSDLLLKDLGLASDLFDSTTEEMKIEDAIHQGLPTPLILTVDFWKKVIERLEGSDGTIYELAIGSVRVLHECGEEVTESTKVLSLLLSLRSPPSAHFLLRPASAFSFDALLRYIELHIHLFFYSPRLLETSPEDLQKVTELLSLLRGDNCEVTSESALPADSSALTIQAFRACDDPGKAIVLSILVAAPILKISSAELLPFLCHICVERQVEGVASLLLDIKALLSSNCKSSVSLLLTESISVLRVDRVESACRSPSIPSSLISEMAAKLLALGDFHLSYFFTHLLNDRLLEEGRANWLFQSIRSLPLAVSALHCQRAVALRDAATASALPLSFQGQEEVRCLVAESKRMWSAVNSVDGQFCLGIGQAEQGEEAFLEDAWRLRQWNTSGFSKRVDTLHSSLFDILRLRREGPEASSSLLHHLKEKVKERLAKASDLASVECRGNVRELKLLECLEEREGMEWREEENEEETESGRKSPVKTRLLLKATSAICRAESEARGENLQLRHDTVIKAVTHLEQLKAFKPAQKLLHDWRAMCGSEELCVRVRMHEARVRAGQGEQPLALHLLQSLTISPNSQMNLERAFIQADIVTSCADGSVEQARALIQEALAGQRVGRENSTGKEKQHAAFARLFKMNAAQLAEADAVRESSGFRMKVDAVKKWRKDLQKPAGVGDISTRVRVEREMRCEEYEIDRMSTRISELAHSAIEAGLNAILFAPSESEWQAETLFPLLNIVFRFSNSGRCAQLLTKHFEDVEVSHWLPALGHVISHVFVHGLLAAPIQRLLERLLESYPFHTLPRLLFYESDKTRLPKLQKLLEKASRSSSSLRVHLKSIPQAYSVVREFTLLSPDDKFFTKLPKSSYRMTKANCMIEQMHCLQKIPLPTLQLEICSDPSAVLSRCIRIEKVEECCDRADGKSAHFVLRVLASDGTKHKIICKKEDVRQDCLVEQLFEVVNIFLHRKERRSHQPLRTYKVVPLSVDAGLIEWCQNTVSMKELLCGLDRLSGLHGEIYRDDYTAHKAIQLLSKAPAHKKLDTFRDICTNMRPVFRHFFYRRYGSVHEWKEKIQAYRKSLAQWSIVCYMVGLGDRHASNILFEPETATFVHIDLGMILEYSSRSLPVPERVPFRMTRDFVDPLIGDLLNGKLLHIAVDTIETLREKSDVILGVASVLLRETMSNFSETSEEKDGVPSKVSEAAIYRLRDKLNGTDASHAAQSPEAQVRRLFAEATDIKNLAELFQGWMAFL